MEETRLSPVLVILSLIGMGLFIGGLYLCLCLQLKQDINRIPSRVETIASAPEDNWIQVTHTNINPEFRHLFPQTNTNSPDYWFNIDRVDRERGLSETISEGRGLIDTTNVGYGFIYPSSSKNSNGLGNIHHTLINSHHDGNQGSSKYQRPLQKIESPPPSYFEATRYVCDQGCIIEMYQPNADRKSHHNGKVEHKNDCNGKRIFSRNDTRLSMPKDYVRPRIKMNVKWDNEEAHKNGVGYSNNINITNTNAGNRDGRDNEGNQRCSRERYNNRRSINEATSVERDERYVTRNYRYISEDGTGYSGVRSGTCDRDENRACVRSSGNITCDSDCIEINI